MGQWMLNLLYIVRDPDQIERMSYSRMRFWNVPAEKIIEAERRMWSGRPHGS